MTAITPPDLTITVRDIRFKGAGSAPTWWHSGDPVPTAFSNALSATFPLGERFFIDSVKRFRSLADPRLDAQIDTFVKQESIHSREHLAFNTVAESRGYKFDQIDDFLRRRLRQTRSRPAIIQLAATVALEHFTAVLAHELLADARYLDGAPVSFQQLWRWHAMEEIEHKAVAFDTLLAATRDYSGLRRWFLRSIVMVSATVLFLNVLFFNVGEFFQQDGIRTYRTWLRFIRYVFVRPGILRRVLGSYLAFYRPGFHPWNIDDRSLIRGFEPALASMGA